MRHNSWQEEGQLHRKPACPRHGSEGLYHSLPCVTADLNTTAQCSALWHSQMVSLAQGSPRWGSEQLTAIHRRELVPTGRTEEVPLFRALPGGYNLRHCVVSRPRNTSWPVPLTGQWDCSSPDCSRLLWKHSLICSTISMRLGLC